MSERKSYPQGVPCWVDSMQPDVRAAVDFYGAVFGWDFEGNDDESYFVARKHGRDVAGLGQMPPGMPLNPNWNMYIRVDDLDAITQEVVGCGGELSAPPFDELPAGRMAVICDTTGAVACLWEPSDRQGAQVVNEPSAWAMSQLITPDPQAAAEFFGKLLGWTTEELGSVTLLRLPGYVGGEPWQPVSREVIATMVKAEPDDDFEYPSRWQTDFWTDDLETLVKTVSDRGGAVVESPFEIAGFKRALLSDPAGVHFTASQLLA